MKKIFIANLFFVFLSFTTQAQRFSNYYGHYLHSGSFTFGTSDDGVVMMSLTSEPGLACNFMHLVKVDSMGGLLWQRRFNLGNASGCQPSDGLETNDHNIIISGGLSDVFTSDSLGLIKMDQSGNVLWAKNYDEPVGGSIISNAGRLVQTSEHGFILSGSHAIIKTDSSGNVLWARRYRINNSATTFGSRGRMIATLDTGFVFMSNSFIDSLNAIRLSKADKNGNIEWSKTFADTGTFWMKSLYQNQNGYIFTKGNTIVQTDFFGDTIWTKSYPLVNTDYFFYILPDDSGIYVNGITLEGTVLLRTNLQGQIQWMKKPIPNNYGMKWMFFDTHDRLKIGGQTGMFIYQIIIAFDDLNNTPCFIDTVPIQSFSSQILVSSDTIVSDTILVNSHSKTILTDDSLFVSGSLCNAINKVESPEKIITTIYPNPSTGKFYVKKLEQESEISVYNLLGKIIYQLSNINSNSEIDLTQQPKGIYFCNIISKRNAVETVKIILQ